MNREKENFYLLQSAKWFIENYYILSLQGDEIEFVNEATEILNNVVDNMKITLDYDRSDTDSMLSEMVELANAITKYLYNEQFIGYYNFEYDPETTYNECKKLTDSINKEYTEIWEDETNIENIGFDEDIQLLCMRIDKLSFMYSAVLKLRFLKTKARQLNLVVDKKEDEDKKSLAYKIAFLDEIGFFEMPKIRKMLVKNQNAIVRMLIGGSTGVISQNRLSLNPNSNVSDKYTAYRFKEDVEAEVRRLGSS